jgi:hypothetical protein
VNEVRASLKNMSANSTAFGLRQPHLQRTQLCTLQDDQLDPQYVAQRAQLKRLVKQLVTPKAVGKTVMDGTALAKLLQDTVEALNKGDIPQAGSVVAVFNRGVLQRCVAAYAAATARVALPVDTLTLTRAHDAALEQARALFAAEHFGKGEMPMDAQFDKEFKVCTTLTPRICRSSLCVRLLPTCACAFCVTLFGEAAARASLARSCAHTRDRDSLILSSRSKTMVSCASATTLPQLSPSEGVASRETAALHA